MIETDDQGRLTIDLPGGRVLFTGRRGGVSNGPYASLNLGWLTDDDPDLVTANRNRVAAAVGIPSERFLYGRQVHGTTVRVADAPRPRTPGVPPPDEDGQVTALSDAAALVLVADCVPIALSSPHGVAALHGGWRGLAGGIVAEGVAALRALGDGDIAAAIGPSAGACCYEVGEEVHAAFGGEFRVGERNLDLHAATRALLEQAGVAHIRDTGVCSMCAADADGPLYFSHRRDRGVTGRQAGLVWRA